MRMRLRSSHSHGLEEQPDCGIKELCTGFVTPLRQEGGQPYNSGPRVSVGQSAYPISRDFM